MSNRLRSSFFRSIVRNKSYSEYYQLAPRTGDLVSRINSDVNQMTESASQSISDTFRSVAQSVAGICMMVYTCPKLTVLSLMAIPPLALMGMFAGRGLRTTSRETANQLGNLTAYASERFSNLREVHASGQNSIECIDFDKHATNLAGAGINEAKSRAIFFGSTGFVGNCILLGVLSAGGEMVQTGVLTIGQLGTFIMYAAYVGVAATKMSTSYSEVLKGMAASDRIWAITSPEEYDEAIDPVELPEHKMEDILKIIRIDPKRPRLELRNVSFKYPSNEADAPTDTMSPAGDEGVVQEAILRDISFDLKAGETIAIAGLSGSGKSTIGLLILKLFEPNNGTIYWNGIDLKDIDQDLWRNHGVSTVLQDTTLFSGTIEDNILYANRSTMNAKSEPVDLNLFNDVLEAAQIHSFVNDLPNSRGIYTQVGEKGLNLSGGQRQRILIARALYKKCPLLILDEATSSLDSDTEFKLYKSMKKYFDKHDVVKTSVISIAHRAATLRAADRILILGRKSENEIGAEVIANGNYRDLRENEATSDNFERLVLYQENL